VRNRELSLEWLPAATQFELSPPPAGVAAESGWVVTIEGESSIATPEEGWYFIWAAQFPMWVTLPQGEEWIPRDALCGCSTLTRIAFPSSVTEGSKNCFIDCKGLRRIVLPRNLDYIPRCAFWGCSNLQQVVASRATVVGHQAFRGCVRLRGRIQLDRRL
jgi:hypothetical protein